MEPNRQRSRRRRFNDPRSEIVWAAIETLDPGQKAELLRELASVAALAVGNPRTDADKVTAGVHALRAVAEILGHSPSIGEYREVRTTLSELKLPPDGTLRRWLAPKWNDCLRRAILDTVTDGDFAARAIGINDRFEDEDVLEALRQCTSELGFPPTVTEYFAWSRRSDVRERPGRRPLSFKPFERFGGIRAALVRAGVLDDHGARYAANGHVLPLRYRYSDEEISDALRAITEWIGHSPRPGDYDAERARIQAEKQWTGETALLPSVEVIRKRHGTWNAALDQAGLPRVTGPSQPHLGTRRPEYSDEEKLEWLRQAWKETGEPFTSNAYRAWRRQKMAAAGASIPCLGTIERTFGGWSRARALALPEHPARSETR